MSDFQNEPRAEKVWCDDDNLWIALVDGRQIGVPLAYFPRLLEATAEQRTKVCMSGGGNRPALGRPR